MTNSNQISHIEMYLNQIKSSNLFFSDLCCFFDEKKIEYGIIGGTIRNALNFEPSFPKDVDIIFNSSDEIIDNYLSEKKIVFDRNSFGGRKIHYNNLDFDIWSLSLHHLFKDGVYKPIFKNIGKTTFINYDSIFYDCSNRKLYDNYSKCIETKLLDLVGNKDAIKSNNRFYSSIGKICFIQKETSIELSKKLQKYIHDELIKDFKNSLFPDEEIETWIISQYQNHLKRKLTFEEKDFFITFIYNFLNKSYINSDFSSENQEAK